jgi:hypothetical protein
MIIEALILACIAWFFVASSLFFKVYWKECVKTKVKKMSMGFGSLPYFLMVKQDRGLSVWVMQAWTAFVFLLFLIIVRTISV